MATVDPSKFYQPTQWANGDASLSSTVVPNWFAGVQPVSFEDAMAKVQQLQLQEAEQQLREQQAEESAIKLENAQRAKEARDDIASLYAEDENPPPEQVVKTLMRYGLTQDALALKGSWRQSKRPRRPMFAQLAAGCGA
jgi:antitoxin component HigA of HigAB toxin-antitoxin module